MSEIQTYRDPRLQPMDAGERPVDWHEDCIHSGACLMQACRFYSRLEIYDDARIIAGALGCGEDCEEYDDGDRVPMRLSGTMRPGGA